MTIGELAHNLSHLSMEDLAAVGSLVLLCYETKTRVGFEEVFPKEVDAIRGIGFYFADFDRLHKFVNSEEMINHWEDSNVATELTEAIKAVKLMRAATTHGMDANTLNMTNDEFCLFMRICNSSLFEHLEEYLNPNISDELKRDNSVHREINELVDKAGDRRQSRQFLNVPIQGNYNPGRISELLENASGFHEERYTPDAAKAHTESTDSEISYDADGSWLRFKSCGYSMDLSVMRGFVFSQVIERLKTVHTEKVAGDIKEIYEDDQVKPTGIRGDLSSKSWDVQLRVHRDNRYEVVYTDTAAKVMAIRYLGMDGMFYRVYCAYVDGDEIQMQEEFLFEDDLIESLYSDLMNKETEKPRYEIRYSKGNNTLYLIAGKYRTAAHIMGRFVIRQFIDRIRGSHNVWIGKNVQNQYNADQCDIIGIHGDAAERDWDKVLSSLRDRHYGLVYSDAETKILSVRQEGTDGAFYRIYCCAVDDNSFIKGQEELLYPVEQVEDIYAKLGN